MNDYDYELGKEFGGGKNQGASCYNMRQLS